MSLLTNLQAVIASMGADFKARTAFAIRSNATTTQNLNPVAGVDVELSASVADFLSSYMSFGANGIGTVLAGGGGWYRVSVVGAVTSTGTRASPVFRVVTTSETLEIDESYIRNQQGSNSDVLSGSTIVELSVGDTVRLNSIRANNSAVETAFAKAAGSIRWTIEKVR